MDIQEISSQELRDSLADTLNQVTYQRAHFIITKHGKESAAMIPIQEYSLFKKAIKEVKVLRKEKAKGLSSRTR